MLDRLALGFDCFCKHLDFGVRLGGQLGLSNQASGSVTPRKNVDISSRYIVSLLSRGSHLGM